jgi:hypothetical protein
VLCLIMTAWACAGVEGRLTGRWQSTKPDSSVALTIAPSGTTHGELRFRDGLSVTFNGTTYAAQYWRVRHVGQNTFLDISNGVVTGAELSGGAVATIPHKVIELTSDKLVLAWDGHGGNSGIYEFRRVQ